jgi:hypothetical protein
METFARKGHLSQGKLGYNFLLFAIEPDLNKASTWESTGDQGGLEVELVNGLWLLLHRSVFWAASGRRSTVPLRFD